MAFGYARSRTIKVISELIRMKSGSKLLWTFFAEFYVSIGIAFGFFTRS